jgi:hypothetical protein
MAASMQGTESCGAMLAALLDVWFQRLAVESPEEVAWVRRWARRYAPEAGQAALAGWLEGEPSETVTPAAGRGALHGVYLAVCERLGPGMADRTLGEAIRQGEVHRSGACSPRDLL